MTTGLLDFGGGGYTKQLLCVSASRDATACHSAAHGVRRPVTAAHRLLTVTPA